jgi:hypothetical protein
MRPVIRQFQRGNVVKFSAEFESAGARVAPASVTCRVRTEASGGSITTLSVANPSLGLYTADLDTQSLSAGKWVVAWQSNGTYDALKEELFEIIEPLIAPV